MLTEIISISREARTVVVRQMPQSQRELIDAICEHWKEHELPWSIVEVLRFEKPQHVFYAVRWIQGDDASEFTQHAPEDDCDSGVEGIPDGCVNFKCDKAPLEDNGVYIVCTKCGASYGVTGQLP